MILNDQQLRASKKNLSKLNTSIGQLEIEEKVASEQFRNLEIQALKGFATDILRDIEAYEELLRGNFKPKKLTILSDLPILLIQTRIALGWSQEKLAKLTNSTVLTLQNYEENAYFGASLSKQLEIAQVLEIDTSECFLDTFDHDASSSKAITPHILNEIDWGKYPVNEAFQMGWIQDTNHTSRTEAFKDWLTNSIDPYAVCALHRKCNNLTVQADEPSLITWQARVLQVANYEANCSELPEFRGDERWIKLLVSAMTEPNGPAKAKNLLREQGILLVVVPHMPKTYLDGATLQTHDGVPIVALTLRQDRLDHFWFTIFHELGHIYCHLYSRFNNGFVDLDVMREESMNAQSSSYVNDDLETEADQFANERLIDSKTWDTCLSRFTVTNETVEADAQRLNVHPSIIAGRIRHEQNNYSILNDLLGQGLVRQHFRECLH